MSLVLDNDTLYRALQAANNPSDAGGIISTVIVNRPDFQILLENEMLRVRLTCFLQLDRKYVRLRNKIKTFPVIWASIFNRRERAKLTSDLEELDEERIAAFKEYEMLRRLVCYDNKLIKVLPS